jgi:hypothetical protein
MTLDSVECASDAVRFDDCLMKSIPVDEIAAVQQRAINVEDIGIGRR